MCLYVSKVNKKKTGSRWAYKTLVPKGHPGNRTLCSLIFTKRWHPGTTEKARRPLSGERRLAYGSSIHGGVIHCFRSAQKAKNHASSGYRMTDRVAVRVLVKYNKLIAFGQSNDLCATEVFMPHKCICIARGTYITLKEYNERYR